MNTSASVVTDAVVRSFFATMNNVGIVDFSAAAISALRIDVRQATQIIDSGEHVVGFGLQPGDQSRLIAADLLPPDLAVGFSVTAALRDQYGIAGSSQHPADVRERGRRALTAVSRAVVVDHCGKRAVSVWFVQIGLDPEISAGIEDVLVLRRVRLRLALRRRRADAR